MKRVLFRILVLGLGALVLLAQTESFAARGGGGRGGGGAEAVVEAAEGARSAAVVAEAAAARAVEWEEADAGVDQQPAFGVGRRLSAGGGQTRNVSRPSSNRAGGLAPNKNVAGGNINRSQASSKIQSRPKGSGSALPSVAQGNRPGTGAGGNRGFPNVADKTGGGQLAGKAQGARGGQLAGKVRAVRVAGCRQAMGAVAGGALAGSAILAPV